MCLTDPDIAGKPLVWRARPQPLITARGRGSERKRSSNYCQSHTSARPMKSPETEMTPPVIGTSRSAGVKSYSVY